MKSPISLVIAVAAGLIVTLGYFLNITALQSLRALLVSWAMIIAAFATWVGVGNLVSVHLARIQTHKPGTPYSLVLIIAFFLTLLIGIVEDILRLTPSILQQVVNSILVPVEASLMAVLAVSLVYAAIRLLRRRRDMLAIIFLGAVIVYLILGSGITSTIDLPILRDIATGLSRLPLAGARGILLGVGLGSLATALRILTGSDRPYGG